MRMTREIKEDKKSQNVGSEVVVIDCTDLTTCILDEEALVGLS